MKKFRFRLQVVLDMREKELEERRRAEAVQARAAEALTAENARLTAELCRLMAFVPEEVLTDRHPTTTEKIEQ